MKRAARFLRLMVVALGLTLVVGAAPARAQFFFPFFDNRPSTPPNAELRRRGAHPRPEGRAVDSRSKGKSGRAKVQPKETGPAKPAAAPAATAGAPNPQAPVVEGPPPPYEPQLLRLSEIMGALAYLQTLCAEPPQVKVKAQVQVQPLAEDHPWRERMETLMTAEGAGPARREKLAGAYNRGLQGYEFSYRVCTPNAQLARRRFLEEGARLAHDISTQYRAN
jgi:uncharacterized protein (TIGR02301 family)